MIFQAPGKKKIHTMIKSIDQSKRLSYSKNRSFHICAFYSASFQREITVVQGEPQGLKYQGAYSPNI